MSAGARRPANGSANDCRIVKSLGQRRKYALEFNETFRQGGTAYAPDGEQLFQPAPGHHIFFYVVDSWRLSSLAPEPDSGLGRLSPVAATIAQRHVRAVFGQQRACSAAPSCPSTIRISPSTAAQ